MVYNRLGFVQQNKGKVVVFYRFIYEITNAYEIING